MEKIRNIAEKVKRQTRSADIIALCDFVLKYAKAKLPARDRREYMREYQRKYRAKKRREGADD